MKSFEKFLKEKCFEENPTILDDDGPDFFDNWLGDLDGQEYMDYAQKWGEEEFEKVKKVADQIYSDLKEASQRQR